VSGIPGVGAAGSILHGLGKIGIGAHALGGVIRTPLALVGEHGPE
jgi:hypothetical protein